MNKMARTSIFIVVATLVNLVMTAAIFLALFVLYGLTLGPILPSGAVAVAVFVCFILAVVGAGFGYKALLKYGQKRYDLEKMLGGRNVKRGDKRLD